MDGKTKIQEGVQAYELVHGEEVGKEWESRIVAPDYRIDHAVLVAEIVESEELMRKTLTKGCNLI